MRAVDRLPRHLLAPLLGLVIAIGSVAAPSTASAAGSGDPASNRSLSHDTDLSCSEDPNGGPCVSAALADINAAHAAEGIQPMVLPSNFASMSVPVQLLNVANLERIDRGLAPILGLSAALNQDAQSAAVRDDDPMPTHFYGTVATANWAGGYDSALEADFGWMYDDGPGSDNLDCASPGQSGCWGHRHDVLWHFDTPIAMGAGYASGQYGPSMTELFVGGDTRTGAGQPDAPVVRPSNASGSTGGGTGTAGSGASNPVTGHAAGSGSKPHPHGWAGAVSSAAGGLRVTVGCSGSRGRRCKVTVAIRAVGKQGHSTVLGVRTVWVAVGHRKVVIVTLGRKARRLLRTRHRLRIHFVVHQGAQVLLNRPVTFRSA